MANEEVCLGSDVQAVRFEAVVPSSVLNKRQKGGKKQLSISINIFSSRSAADDVGSRLSKLQGYLQHPKFRLEVDYYNPQFLTFDDTCSNMNDLIDIDSESSLALPTHISEEIERIFESLTDVSPELTLELPPGLTSTLKKHQEDGLRFIIQREHEYFSQQLSAQLRQVITPKYSETPHSSNNEQLSTSLGGLIADTMGLGKTLTILVAILHSTREAALFGNVPRAPEYEYEGNLPTKATLVVVPSYQLLDNWVSEVKTHFSADALSLIRFHGQSRPKDIEPLRNADLVLTTYKTLTADFGTLRVLYQLEWYRVVLDEAHGIRNPRTADFQTASELHTKRRWCLTGTPIQNRLEDLASLARFLKLPPLPERLPPNTMLPEMPLPKRGAFGKYILGALLKGGADSTKPLRTYLEAYCLRRSQACLTLPPHHQEDVMLQLSFEEKRHYDAIIHATKQHIDSLVSSGVAGSGSARLEAITKMRLLCNHGTLLSLVDDRCETCLARETTTSTPSTNCPDCGKPLRLSSPRPNPDIAQIQEVMENLSLEGGGPTKLRAVVQNVISSGPKTKSIVFSFFKGTLVLLSLLLKRVNVSYRQIDGNLEGAKRSKYLREFQEDPQIHVLLMTIGTGSVGLNLTVASQVHIVEPQWNPSVEEQAIGRAVRLGQTREVRDFRYRMENTVEQNIFNLQQKKKRLAKFTFDTRTEQSPAGILKVSRYSSLLSSYADGVVGCPARDSARS
ncbi:SNF2 family N-terminal domain-containing protein [Nemania sp. FL0031]|nr:SNF2 family N-terminal domain-containing protein [Nemania sp. FL0031]